MASVKQLTGFILISSLVLLGKFVMIERKLIRVEWLGESLIRVKNNNVEFVVASRTKRGNITLPKPLSNDKKSSDSYVEVADETILHSYSSFGIIRINFDDFFLLVLLFNSITICIIYLNFFEKISTSQIVCFFIE